MPITEHCFGISEFLRLPAVSDFCTYRAGPFPVINDDARRREGGGESHSFTRFPDFIIKSQTVQRKQGNDLETSWDVASNENSVNNLKTRQQSLSQGRANSPAVPESTMVLRRPFNNRCCLYYCQQFIKTDELRWLVPSCFWSSVLTHSSRNAPLQPRALQQQCFQMTQR